MSSCVALLRQTAIERHGKHGLRLIVAALHSVRRSDPESVRSSLRDCGVFLPDQAFAQFVAQYAQKDGTVHIGALVSQVIGKLNPHRQLVLDALFDHLGLNRSGEMAKSALYRAYDASRHPDVLAGRRSAMEVTDTFMAPFGEVVSRDDIAAYYSAVSDLTPTDKAYDLLLVRSWSLDRPKSGLSDSLELTNSSTMRTTENTPHPLYQTSASVIGSRSTGCTAERSFNRTGAFTKHAPTPKPGTSLNTGTTRSIV